MKINQNVPANFSSDLDSQKLPSRSASSKKIWVFVFFLLIIIGLSSYFLFFKNSDLSSEELRVAVLEKSASLSSYHLATAILSNMTISFNST